ncbi:MAG: glycosyltransferase, partial [Allosphingosinicella sp.]
LGAADVMLLPTASEGLANVWVESLACGTPVVTTDIPGADEAIGPGCGRRVERSALALAAAVRDVLAQPVDPQLLRRSAEAFSWARNSAELVDHFTFLLTPSQRFKAA